MVLSTLVVAITGASGMLVAKQLISACPWPVSLIFSQPGQDVYKRECGDFTELTDMAHEAYQGEDLSAPLASGSVSTLGMIVAPCTSNTMAEIASGTSGNLVSRAAHCHLKERRKLVLCLRETPLTLMDIENARTVTLGGGVIMPISPPFFMTTGQDPDKVSMTQLVDLYVERVLALFGKTPSKTWEHVR